MGIATAHQRYTAEMAYNRLRVNAPDGSLPAWEEFMATKQSGVDPIMTGGPDRAPECSWMSMLGNVARAAYVNAYQAEKARARPGVPIVLFEDAWARVAEAVLVASMTVGVRHIVVETIEPGDEVDVRATVTDGQFVFALRRVHPHAGGTTVPPAASGPG